MSELAGGGWRSEVQNKDGNGSTQDHRDPIMAEAWNIRKANFHGVDLPLTVHWLNKRKSVRAA